MKYENYNKDKITTWFHDRKMLSRRKNNVQWIYVGFMISFIYYKKGLHKNQLELMEDQES